MKPGSFPLYEILQGRVEINRIRNVEIEDLLGRDAVHLDSDTLQEFLSDKKVL